MTWFLGAFQHSLEFLAIGRQMEPTLVEYFVVFAVDESVGAKIAQCLHYPLL